MKNILFFCISFSCVYAAQGQQVDSSDSVASKSFKEAQLGFLLVKFRNLNCVHKSLFATAEIWRNAAESPAYSYQERHQYQARLRRLVDDNRQAFYLRYAYAGEIIRLQAELGVVSEPETKTE